MEYHLLHNSFEPHLIDTFSMCFFPPLSARFVSEVWEKLLCYYRHQRLLCSVNRLISLSSCWADITQRTLSVWSQQAMYMNVNMEKHSRWTICALAASWSAHTSNEYVTLCRRLYLSNVVSIVQHVPFYAINTFLVIFTCAPAGWAHSCLLYRRWKQEVKRRLPDFFHIWQMLHST